MKSLYAAMRRADADIYYHNSAEYVTGLAAMWCRRYRRKFVYSAAAELACDARLPLLNRTHDRLLYRIGVRQAHLRIVQTQRQHELLREGWNLDSIVLPMPCPGPAVIGYRAPNPPQPARVLWAGRLDSNKRLDWLLKIATALPDIEFEVATAINHHGEFAEGLRQRAERLPNVLWLGPVAREQMPDLYRRATCLCCTSQHEGFPNTFIEAWSHGIPVVTTFDPDGVVQRLGLGFVAYDILGLTNGISSLAEQSALWLNYSRRARDYYTANHQQDAALRRFETAFTQLFVVG
jgi:glycosyltransferase involved in cell wall biosynthesis